MESEWRCRGCGETNPADIDVCINCRDARTSSTTSTGVHQTGRQDVSSHLGALRNLPPPPFDNATFSTIRSAIEALGRSGNDSSQVLDCLDAFVPRDPDFHAIEALRALAETSDQALSRLLAWHRRIDKAQVAGYELIKIQRNSHAIAESFRRIMSDGRYNTHAKETARKFFDAHPQLGRPDDRTTAAIRGQHVSGGYAGGGKAKVSASQLAVKRCVRCHHHLVANRKTENECPKCGGQLVDTEATFRLVVRILLIAVILFIIGGVLYLISQ